MNVVDPNVMLGCAPSKKVREYPHPTSTMHRCEEVEERGASHRSACLSSLPHMVPTSRRWQRYRRSRLESPSLNISAAAISIIGIVTVKGHRSHKWHVIEQKIESELL